MTGPDTYTCDCDYDQKGVHVKKIIAAIAGIVVLSGAGYGLWLVLDSTAAVATVGTHKVSASDVTDSVNAILAERKVVSTTGMQLASGKDLELAEVNFHVISYLLADTAAANHVSVTDAQVAARRADIVKQVGSEAKMPQALASANIAKKDFPLYLKTLLYDEGLAAHLEKTGTSKATVGATLQAMVTAQANKIGVKVNSKYGKWDATQAAVVSNTATAAPAATK